MYVYFGGPKNKLYQKAMDKTFCLDTVISNGDAVDNLIYYSV